VTPLLRRLRAFQRAEHRLLLAIWQAYPPGREVTWFERGSDIPRHGKVIGHHGDVLLNQAQFRIETAIGRELFVSVERIVQGSENASITRRE
jgi:hypothetical protein